jgi:hypothetical protein
MIIGIDFDNTIVSYDAVFRRIAQEEGLALPGNQTGKTALRDCLRAAGREPRWTEIQGEVYGTRIAEAEPYEGALEFMAECRRQGVEIRIVSHKTRQPYLGKPCDLHVAARGWLRQHEFLDSSSTGISAAQVFFEPTKAGKLARIAACGCTHFIDDLPELLGDAQFPPDVKKYLFDPNGVNGDEGGIVRVRDWKSLLGRLLPWAKWRPAVVRIAAGKGLSLASARPIPLEGGANNRVYRLPLSSGGAALLKHYFQNPGDTRDRFSSERAFYRYAEAIGLTQVPECLGWDESLRLGVFSFIPGKPPAEAEPAHIEAALAFVRELNRHRTLPEALSLPRAAEACFSMDEHLATIQARIERMNTLPQADALDTEAQAFVNDDLAAAWTATTDALRNQFGAGERARVLGQDEICISPSDFGFHNSLVRGGETAFIDFEYAGWDDPAKLVCDFFCQPDVPVASSFLDSFLHSVGRSLGLSGPGAFATRCRALLPAYQIKWICILLADFTETGKQRREFSLGQPAARARRARQLARARSLHESLLQRA